MDALLNLLFLYIIFMLFSSFLKKTTTAKRSQEQQEPSQPSPTLAEDLQTKFKHYARKLDEYLAQQTPPPGPRLPVPSQLPGSRLPAPSEIEPFEEDRIEATEQELEELLRAAAPRHVERIVAPARREPQSDKTGKAHRVESLTGAFRRPKGLLRGIILSEILGPPASQRPRRFPRKA